MWPWLAGLARHLPSHGRPSFQAAPLQPHSGALASGLRSERKDRTGDSVESRGPWVV